MGSSITNNCPGVLNLEKKMLRLKNWTTLFPSLFSNGMAFTHMVTQPTTINIYLFPNEITNGPMKSIPYTSNNSTSKIGVR